MSRARTGDVREVCIRAAHVASVMGGLSTATKDACLGAMSTALCDRAAELIEANAADVDAARSAGSSGATVDRLTLTKERIDAMAGGLLALVAQGDPAGEVVSSWRRPNGLLVQEVRAPLGVVAVIYEARPNVTADVAGLCLKSGNACVLRGSSSALRSNVALAEVLSEAAQGAGAPPAAIQLIEDSGRDAALELMRAKGLVDLLVPRGGRGLIQTIEEHATVPFIIDGDGNCHVYVDRSADQAVATSIVVNAKTQRPGVCNAAETLVVHRDIADAWLPHALDALDATGVEIRGDEAVCRLWAKALPATDEDWSTEYLGLVLAVKVVGSIDEAIAHINRWGTSSAEAIVTADTAAARRFTTEVDSGSVFVNASTRFSDGGQLGYGAEIGISTQKLHARGPMGLRALTATKHVVWGDGQVRR